jgi:hypothetical protein
MVARIKIGKSIRGILHYNEHKVEAGTARLLLANSFATEIIKADFAMKLRRFEYLNELKPSVKTNALHISLNFDSSEKLDDVIMQYIALRYMELLGFADQPFLVYRHTDAAHPHLHIATTSIQSNGEPINLHNIGWSRSEPARKQIEKEFRLVVAQNKKHEKLTPLKAIDIKQAKYSEIPIKRALSNIIQAVLEHYSFSTFGEFNAILQQFNVTAERGKEGSEMFQKKGLIYSIIDKKGTAVGVPIKASSFYHKPMLARVEEKFATISLQRKTHKEYLKTVLGDIFLKYHKIRETTLKAELAKHGVNVILRQNKEGMIYGVTYIDNKNLVAFNGSALGKAYSAKEITAHLAERNVQRSFLRSQDKSTEIKLSVPSSMEIPQFQDVSHTVDKLLQIKGGQGAEEQIRKKKKRFRNHL